MYAVIRSGGKQYKVTKGQRLRLDLIDAEPGSTLDLSDILAVHNGETLTLGKPLVESASVKVKVLSHGRGKKIIVFRFKRRQGYHCKKGHRQDFTEVLIEDIKC